MSFDWTVSEFSTIDAIGSQVRGNNPYLLMMLTFSKSLVKCSMTVL